MSNRTIECQLDLIINLLETLPERLIDAVEKRDEEATQENLRWSWEGDKC